MDDGHVCPIPRGAPPHNTTTWRCECGQCWVWENKRWRMVG